MKIKINGVEVESKDPKELVSFFKEFVNDAELKPSVDGKRHKFSSYARWTSEEVKFLEEHRDWTNFRIAKAIKKVSGNKRTYASINAFRNKFNLYGKKAK